MAKSADAADLKSAVLKWTWGFKSPSGHHIFQPVGLSLVVCPPPLGRWLRPNFVQAFCRLGAPVESTLVSCAIWGDGWRIAIHRYPPVRQTFHTATAFRRSNCNQEVIVGTATLS